MKIISKLDAHKILVESLFKVGGTACISKFDKGKYEWTGKAKDYIGKEVIDIPGVLAVYVERRQNEDGPYACLMSITEN